MNASYQHKVDPRLRRIVERRIAGQATPVFLEVANAAAAEWVRKQPGVRKLVHVVDGYYTATVRVDRIGKIAAHEGVMEVEALRFLRPHLTVSRKSIHATARPAGGGGMPDGRGVVIGLVDYGLDFTQKDFQNPRRGKPRDACNPRGRTRIAYLWDQRLKPRGRERAPAKYRYGVEYSWKNIDRALRANRPERVRHDPVDRRSDISGHGTHVAGIAAGNGTTFDRKFPVDRYIGIAPAATLVFVNLNRKAIIRQVNAPRGTLANSVNIAHGVAYCFEKANELGMPCVVNLSLGSNGGGHDGNMALEWIIDGLLQESGRAVVIAAGNEDGKAVHATRTLRKGESCALEWHIGANNENDPNRNELEVWYPRGCAINASLVAPDKQASRKVAPGRSGTFRFRGGERVSIYSDPTTPWDGAARIHVELNGPQKKGIRFGKWTVRLRATRVAPTEAGDRVRFDAWIERTLPAVSDQPEAESRFGRYDSRTAVSVTTPGTARRAITVASYANDRPPSVFPAASVFSGRGPTRDQRRKPELAAPGETVLSTHAGAGWLKENGKTRPARVAKAGTSMAAPHVTGVIARMLGRNAYLTAEEIREILVMSATPHRGAPGRWNRKFGYGRLHAARAVELVDQLIGSRRTKA
jgi:subtilisin family serine protease